jgi:hypothetical protein
MTPTEDSGEKLAAELTKRNDMVRQLDELEITMMRQGDDASDQGDWITAHEKYAQAVGAQWVWHTVVARRERFGKIDRDAVLADKLAKARGMLVQKLGQQ